MENSVNRIGEMVKFEYLVRIKTRDRWEPWTGIWGTAYTQKQVSDFMISHWSGRRNRQTFGIFKREFIIKDGKRLRKKWELIEKLKM